MKSTSRRNAYSLGWKDIPFYVQAGKNAEFENKRARPYVARPGALLGVTVLGVR